MTDIVRLNDTIVSWNSVSFKIDGIPYVGILSFDYEQTREREAVYGAKRDGRPLGFTSGKYSVPSMTLKMLRDSWDDLSTQLTALGLGSIGDATFTMIVQYIEIGQPPITVVCVGCRIKGIKPTLEEGTGAATTELDIQCIEIVENGKPLASVVRAVPL